MYPALKVATLKADQKAVSKTLFLTFYNYMYQNVECGYNKGRK